MRRSLILIAVNLILLGLLLNAEGRQGFYTGIRVGQFRLNQDDLGQNLVYSDTSTYYQAAGAVTQGYSINNFSLISQALNSFTTKQVNTSYGTELFIGYQFMPFFAMEFGYNYSRNFKTNYHANTSTTITYKVNNNANGPQTIATDIKHTTNTKAHIFELVGKGILPLQYNVELFAKLGYAFYFKNVENRVNGTNPQAFTTTSPAVNVPANTLSKTINLSSTSTRKAIPTLSIGGSYVHSDHLVFDVTYTKYLLNINKDVDNFQFSSLGVAYFYS